MHLVLSLKCVHLLQTWHTLHDVEHRLVVRLVLENDVVHLSVRYAFSSVPLVMDESAAGSPLTSFRAVEELTWICLWSSVEIAR